jgi:aspartyl-tRNA(Asn)/glutamyl-tRNA(Gln) amidotransferase subunit B
LPIINPEVIESSIKLAISLGMKISEKIVFDRKIYNYFDLPKGYQITQKDNVFAYSGSLKAIDNEGELKIFNIKNIQIEEDTAKSLYSEEGVKLDFNRSGNPLIELVTDPILTKIEDVCLFVKNLQFLLRYLDISEAKMEKGQIRIDTNFSFFNKEKNYQTPRYEIKNLNSLKNIEESLAHESKKHEEFFLKGVEVPVSQTLNFNEKKKITEENREKTNYYFLPESNIPPIIIEDSDLESIKSKLKKMPHNYVEELNENGIKINKEVLKNPFILKSFSYLEEKGGVSVEEDLNK